LATNRSRFARNSSITRRTGGDRRMIYYYFGGKEGLRHPAGRAASPEGPGDAYTVLRYVAVDPGSTTAAI
jgi:hypothetical protein